MESNNINLLNSLLDSKIDEGNLDKLAENYYTKYSKNEEIKNIKTPCYIIDKDKLTSNIKNIINTSGKYFKNNLKIYYPVKINNHKLILDEMVKNNIGLEVASIDEYKLAIMQKASNILYYAPGKTNEDIEYFVDNSNSNHTIHIDSFNELIKINKITNQKEKNINIGVRIFTDDFGEWQKYGINLNDLELFISETIKNKYLIFKGIHFHTSRNKTSEIYINTLKNIGECLSKINRSILKKIEYIDFGGGFELSDIEGSYFKGTCKGQLENIIGISTYDESNKIITLKSNSIDAYFKDISNSIEKYILPILGNGIKFITEPGRIFVSDVMHILSKVADVKDVNKYIVILDSGVNMIGWQRGEFEYFPVINLSSEKFGINRNVLMYGNLCTTWDHWGYYCYTDRNLKNDDLILLSNQGTLSYSLAQQFFISKLPKVHII